MQPSNTSCASAWTAPCRRSNDQDLGRIIRSRNATARALASGSSGGSFQARLGRMLHDRGTLIVAAWAGFAGRLGGRAVTMVMDRAARLDRHTDASAAAAYRANDPFSADDLNVRVCLANIVDVAGAVAPGTRLSGGGPGQTQLLGHGSVISMGAAVCRQPPTCRAMRRR